MKIIDRVIQRLFSYTFNGVAPFTKFVGETTYSNGITAGTYLVGHKKTHSISVDQSDIDYHLKDRRAKYLDYNIAVGNRLYKTVSGAVESLSDGETDIEVLDKNDYILCDKLTMFPTCHVRVVKNNGGIIYYVSKNA